MGAVIGSPYSNEATTWLRGNLHAHTTNSDGRRAPQDVVDEYAARGYDFLMISDHDVLTVPASVEAHGMTLLPGVEVTANGPHILHVDASYAVTPDADRQSVIAAINAAGGFAIVAHPNWEKSFAHCPREALESWEGITGIEVYNGVVRRLDGSPLATDRWDRLLGLGRKVWGYAHDDSHRAGDDGVAWNMVQSADRSAKAIGAALRAGQCYASTGVVIERIRVHGRAINVETRNAQRIIAHSDFGHREVTCDAATVTFTVPEDTAITYVRFECWGAGEQMAWTQPFYVEKT